MRKVAIVFLIFIAGCVKIPLDEANCKMLETPCIETGYASEGEFPDPNWWEMFGDPQLTALIQRALEDSPTLSRVAARVMEADAEASVKFSRLLPQLGLSASVNYQNLGKFNLFRAYAPTIFPAHVDEYTLDLNISYEVDFWGKNRHIYRSALGRAQAEIAEQQTAILVLTTSVASIYFKLQAEMQQLKLLEEERKIVEKISGLTQSRQENALDSTTQVLITDNQVLALDQSIQYSIQRVGLARHILNRLIGQGPDLCEDVRQVSLNCNIHFPLPCNISSELLFRRSDLVAQIWRIEAAAHMVGAAETEFYPSIDLFAVLGLEGVFSDRFFNWGSRFRSIMPAIHIPIFTAGRLRANLREKRAEFEQMIYRYNEDVLYAAQEVADQILILRTTNENLKSEELLLQNKMQNRDFAKSRYLNAIESLSHYLDAENQLLQEQIENIALQYQQITAVIQLIKALGGGYCLPQSEVPLGY
jgi:NodT family efflux transporter outer membrane factor (OMF) lipoprotein